MSEITTPAPKRKQGFASMDPARQREIAAKGGVAAHHKGTGHEWTRDEAREAGRKGGLSRKRQVAAEEDLRRRAAELDAKHGLTPGS